MWNLTIRGVQVLCDSCHLHRALLCYDDRGRLCVPPGWLEFEVVEENVSIDHCPACIEEANQAIRKALGKGPS